jgi:hypothetical protein
VREKSEKRYCDSVVYRHLMQQLWCFFSAVRLGALVSTGYYPDLHLKYNDVLFALVRRRDGAAKFTIVLTQRWRKGKKEKVAEK